MIADTTTSAPRRWGPVLGETLIVYLMSGVTGLFGGLLLFTGLVALLAGPEAVPRVTDVDLFEQFPAEVQALLLGDGIWLCTTLVGVPCGLASLGFVLSKTGRPAREYLGLKWPTLRQALGWGGLILGAKFTALFASQALGLSWGGDDDYMELAGVPLFIPLLVLALAVLGPVFEEVMFRGFLLEGLRHTRLGEAGAILFTAGLWTVLHTGTSVRLWVLLVTGVLMAVARLRTGSLYLVVIIHVITNLIAVLAMIADA